MQKEEENKKRSVLFAITCFGIDSTNSSVCSGNGNCTSTDTCSCYPGYNGNQCQNTCPSLTLSSVAVPNTGDKVIFSFNQFIASTTITACNNGIANIIQNATLSKFGVGATCSSNNPNQLTINLGSSKVNITKSDLIYFVNNTLLAVGGCGNYFNTPVQINSVPKPVAVLAGPNQISSCSQSFLLDASASNTGRFTFGWSMKNNGFGDYNSTLDTYLQSLPTNTTSVTLSSDSFVVGAPSTIQLTLTNLFDYTTVTTTLNIYKNSYESPVVVLNCPPSVIITQSYQFSPIVSPSCGRTGVTYTYSWVSDIGVSTSNILTIPANTYKLGNTYNVSLTTTQLSSGVTNGNATTFCSFTGVAPNPIAKTSNEGNTVTLKNNQQLTVDGSASSDLAGNPLYYNWTCCTLTSAGCDFSDCSKQFPTLLSTFSNKYTLATTLPTGVFKFFITATTSDMRTATSLGETYNIVSSSVAVILTSTVTVQTSMLSVCVNRNPASTSDTFNWALFAGDMTLPTTLNSACIYPLLSNIRADSILTATVTSGGVQYQLLVNVYAPFTPKGGSASILNTDLSAATFPLSQTTNYLLSAPGWIGRSAGSLQYTYTIADLSGNPVFTTVSTNSQVQLSSTSIPKASAQTNYQFLVSIIDTTTSPSGNLAATVSSQISIGAYALNGQTPENAASSILTTVQSCASGDTSCLLNGLTSVGTVLNFNSVKGSTTRQSIVSQSLTLLTNNLASLNSLGRNYLGDVLPLLSSFGSNSQDLTATSSNTVISLFSSSIIGSKITLTSTQVTTVFNTLSNCFKTLSTQTSTFLNQLNTNQQSAISTRTILKKIALGVESNPGTTTDYSTTDYGLTLYRYASASNVPTSTITNTYFQFTAPSLNLPATNGPIDLIVTRYQTGYFYGNNYVNNSFPTIGFEFVRKDTNNIIPVTGLTSPIIFVISGNGPSSSCSYLDTTSGSWATDGVGTKDTNNGLNCNTTHLTEFTGFSIYNPGTQNPPSADNNLYYLLLLLLIFPICLIFAVIIGFIGFTCFKIFQGRANLNFFKKIGGSKGASSSNTVSTDKDKDMIDLGI